MKENIDALAREYAEKFCDNLIYKEETAERDKLTDIRNISETASNFLEWLLVSHSMVKRNGDKETIDEINALIIGIQPNEGKVSDGYHTFDELYDFRRAYNAALVNTHKYPCIKSCRHSDGELCFGGGWFVVQMQLPTGQISNHYEIKYWDEFDCEVRERADEWDGHTDKDVLERLTKLNLSNSKLNK